MLDPFRKPWRAHPQLEGLSDTECRELIDRRWRRDPPRLWLIPAAAIATGAAWVVAIGVFLMQTPLVDDESLDQTAVYTAIIAAELGGGLALALLTGYLVRWSMLRATLRRLVAGATCPRCRHSLIGLPIFDDATRPDDRSRMRVRCPECGKRIRLLKYGYGPEDLAPWSERVLPKDFEVRIRR